MINVILVEDEQDYSTYVDNIVKYAAPVSIDKVSSKTEFSELIINEDINHVLICDISLNRFDKRDRSGLKIITEFRKRFPNSLILAISNHDHLEKLCLESGANRFFDKSEVELIQTEIELLIQKFNILNQLCTEKLGIGISNISLDRITPKSRLKCIVVNKNEERNIITLNCLFEKQRFTKTYPLNELSLKNEVLIPDTSLDIYFTNVGRFEFISTTSYTEYFDSSRFQIDEYKSLNPNPYLKNTSFLKND
jgi:CheY-like chemotaxis protein